MIISALTPPVLRALGRACASATGPKPGSCALTSFPQQRSVLRALPQSVVELAWALLRRGKAVVAGLLSLSLSPGGHGTPNPI